jgi:hypothetical protein
VSSLRRLKNILSPPKKGRGVTKGDESMVVSIGESPNFEYDNQGRLKYHPDFHPNHKKTFTESDLEYLCKYYEVDGKKKMSLALGKTETTVSMKVVLLKKNGLFDYYKNLNKHW